jgi:hypothetical protein
VIYENDNHGEMISTGENSDSSTRALWQAYQESTSSKAGGTGEVNDEFCVTKYLFHTWKEHAVKSYDMGPTALLPLRREGGAAADFYRPWADLDPGTLGTIASTHATRPPRATVSYFRPFSFRSYVMRFETASVRQPCSQ